MSIFTISFFMFKKLLRLFSRCYIIDDRHLEQHHMFQTKNDRSARSVVFYDGLFRLTFSVIALTSNKLKIITDNINR